jgi:hypothetical protein
VSSCVVSYGVHGIKWSWARWHWVREQKQQEKRAMREHEYPFEVIPVREFFILAYMVANQKKKIAIPYPDVSYLVENQFLKQSRFGLEDRQEARLAGLASPVADRVREYEIPSHMWTALQLRKDELDLRNEREFKKMNELDKARLQSFLDLVEQQVSN